MKGLLIGLLILAAIGGMGLCVTASFVAKGAKGAMKGGGHGGMGAGGMRRGGGGQLGMLVQQFFNRRRF